MKMDFLLLLIMSWMGEDGMLLCSLSRATFSSQNSHLFSPSTVIWQRHTAYQDTETVGNVVYGAFRFFHFKIELGMVFS